MFNSTDTNLKSIELNNLKADIGCLSDSNLNFKINKINNLNMIDNKLNKSTIINELNVNKQSNNQSSINSKIIEINVCSTCGLIKNNLLNNKCNECNQKCVNNNLVIKKIRKKRKKKLTTKLKKQIVNNIESNSEDKNSITITSIKQSSTSNQNKISPSSTNLNNNSKNVNNQQTPFSWKKYLADTNSTPAPLKCFKPNQTYNNKPNYFKTNMKLEAIDPQHQSLFCVATVAEVCGYRLRIHFDGYSSQFDFWVNCDSPFIFHPGFCDKTNRKLQPPKNYSKKFNWSTYLSEEKAKAAPKNCFYWFNKQINQPAGFKVGMKLEAVDRSSNSSLICVASINDIISDWLLIHFDGWDNSYDYWTQINSPYLHPINWCKSKGKILTPPKDYAKLNKFDWQDYLMETNSSCVISNLFKCRSSNSFKLLMKLEAVDKRNPRFMRVATIIDKKSHSIKVRFDNFNEKFDCWYDDSSPDLHPIQWCLIANNNFLIDPTTNNCLGLKSSTGSCKVENCNGLGNLRNHNLITHKKVDDCPYYNLNYEIPDRIGDTNEIYFSDEHSFYSLDCNSLNSSNKNSNCQKSASTFSDSFSFDKLSSNLENKNKLILDDSDIEFDSQINKYVNNLNAGEFLRWTSDQIANFVYSILPTSLPEQELVKKKFIDEKIDGESFLLLTQNDLINILQINLRPAFLIYKTICTLRKKLMN